MLIHIRASDTNNNEREKGKSFEKKGNKSIRNV